MMAAKLCSVPGCPEFDCRRHANRKPPRAERPRDRFYDTARWRRVRARVLKKHPLCADHEARGMVVEAREVDHIVPMADGGAACDEGNLRALCKSCHSRRTLAALRGRGG